MADFINYYAELDLNNDLTTKEIIEKLVQLERVWHQREIIQPEKARKVLSLIDDAKSVFSDDKERERYDALLLEYNSAEPDNNSEEQKRKRNFLLYYNQASEFYKGKEYDLAKISIEKSLQYVDSDSETEDYYVLVADVYQANNELDLSINYINRAIMLNATNGGLFYYKGQLFLRQGTINKDNVFELGEKALHCFEKSLDLAQNKNEKELEAASAAYIAYITMVTNPANEEKALKFANYALSIGDNTGTAQKVIINIEQNRQIAKKNAERFEKYNQMLNETIPSSNKYSIDYCADKFSFKNIAYEGEVIGQIFLECIIQALSKFGIGVPAETHGGIYREFSSAGDYSKYKYHGFLVYIKKGGLYTGPNEWIQIYVTSENKLLIDFKSSSIVSDNTNNEIAIEIAKCAIEAEIANEDAVIVPIYSKSKKNSRNHNSANTESAQYQTNQKVSTQKTELKQKQIDEKIEFENKRRDAISDIVDKYDSDLEEWMYEDEFYCCPQCHKELERYSVYDDKIWLCSCGYDILEEVLSEKTHDNEVQDNISDNTTYAEEQEKIQDNIFDNTTDIEEQEDVNDNSAWNWKKDFVYWMLVVFLYAMLCAMTESYTSSLFISAVIGIVGYYILRKRKNKH